MKLTALRLHNFRCHKEAVFTFSPEINYIYGGNGAGKTSILEAIYLLMCGASFRTSQNIELIKRGEPSLFVEATFTKHDVEQTVKLGYDGKGKKIAINNNALTSYSQLFGAIVGVLFAPDDVALVKGAPGKRRQFLDLFISQTDPLYVHYLTRFQRAMKQRNSLLKKGCFQAIFPFEEQMASAAEYITKRRGEAVKSLTTPCRVLYGELSAKEGPPLILSLHSSLKRLGDDAIKERYLAILERNRPREKEAGITFVGPHKDDLSICFDDQEVKSYGSEGEQRSCVAAIHLASWQCMKERCGLPPLMLIDDVGIGLDGERRERVNATLEKMGQVFVTSTERAKGRERINCIEIE